jgi:nucleoid DNA-binding protein
MATNHTVSRTRRKGTTPKHRASRVLMSTRGLDSDAKNIRLNGRTKLTDGVIAEHVARLTGLEPGHAKALVDRMFSIIRATLLSGRPVSLPSICTLSPYNKKARHFRHPQTRQLIFKKRCRYIRLTLAQSFRQELADDGKDG